MKARFDNILTLYRWKPDLIRFQPLTDGSKIIYDVDGGMF